MGVYFTSAPASDLPPARRSRSSMAARPASTSVGCSSNKRPTTLAAPCRSAARAGMLERARFGRARLARRASGTRPRA